VSSPGRNEPPNTWPDHETAQMIDADHYIMWADHRGWTRDENGLVTAESARGVMEWHWDRTNRRWCGGLVSFEPGNHRLISTNPLHIEPSLLCNQCPEHGWIRGGRWSPA
jgi:hypothetical protein